MKILIIDNDKSMTDQLKKDLDAFFGNLYENIIFDIYSTNFLSIEFKKDYDFAFVDIDLNNEYNGIEFNQILNLKYKNESNIIPISKIIIIEGQVHQLTITSLDSQYYDNRSLKTLYNLLPHTKFVQIHKSYIINLDYLMKYKGGKVIMANGEEINVGRPYKENFNNVFKEYLIK